MTKITIASLEAGSSEDKKIFTVYVIDHFDPPDDPDKTYQSGAFESYARAEAHCKEIIDGYFDSPQEIADRLKSDNKALTVEDIYKDWLMFGETPFIKPSDGNSFSARTYAKKCAKSAFDAILKIVKV